MATSSDLMVNLKDLLSTGIFSDLNILCGGREFKVHKNILYLQSPFFRKQLGGEFKESAEEQSTIELDDDPDALHALIRHLYNCGYDDTICKENVMSFNVKVYAIADKYDVKQLQKFAATRLSRVCDPERDLNDFIATVYAIDECNNPKDRTLWDVVIPKIKNNISYLLGTAEFRVVLDDIPQLKFDLLALLDAARPFTYGPPAFETQVRDAEEDDEDDESTVPIPSPRGGRYAGRGRRLG